MTTTKTFGFALASLAAAFSLNTGCAGDAPGGDPNDPSNPTNPDDPTPDEDMTVTGRYKMNSTFDIATNMPGTAGQITNHFIAATNDPDDPTNWLLEQMINAMPSGAVRTALDSARGFVAGYLNDRLLQWAPDFVSTMVEIGNNLGDITKNFGLIEELDITLAQLEGSYAASHTVTGVRLKLDANERDFMFADNGLDEASVAAISTSVDGNGKITLGAHTLPVQYGAVIRIALDNMVIPAIDANATNLGELFNNQIDCYAVGGMIASAVGFGSASTYRGACETGVTAGANFLYSKISDVDANALEFGIAGSGRALDTNNDGTADKIQTGTWTGDLSYAGTPAPLSTATFRGERM